MHLFTDLFIYVWIYFVFKDFEFYFILIFSQILGNHTEFQRVAALLQDSVNFDIDVNASVFETNIRGENPISRLI